MRYMVVLEKGEESWGAYVPDLPGCVAVGETEDEVKQLIQEAIEFHLEDLTESGAELPAPISKSEYVEVMAA
jgi:predicted RNase H-like HicB family nuclease